MGILDRFKAFFDQGKLDVAQRFELLREAVSGTMSKFYMARDRQNDQIVGLKIGDREKVAYFEGRFKGLKKPPEGEIASKMQHPYIVKTLEYGMTTDDLPYVVMEFLEGQGLHVLIHKKDPQLVGRRVELIRQMGEALREVHRQGFIHRDVCPRNFICSSDRGTLKLIDFGLTLPAERDFMQPGNRTGTPLYMAPEVVRRRWTDQRLDIFAFGVTAFQLMTFELPWHTTEATGKAALAHDTEIATDITDYCPQLNHVLARSIMKCIQPDPNHRPAQIDEFLASIRSVTSENE